MAGSSRLEERLAEIAALEGTGTLGTEQVRLLRQAIGAGSSLLIGRAAAVVRKRGIASLVPDLVAAFHDLLGKPAKVDKGCLAKTAVAESLNALGCTDEEPFLRGVRHRQWEPTYGKMLETAARLRAECAMGLARISHPRAAQEILPLLVDAEPEARAAGVRALAYLGGDAGDVLLRMKALVGDEHPAVVGECLSALVKMDPAGAVAFVRGFLASPDLMIVEEAAMALATMQDSRAARILCACRTSRVDQAFRERMLLPIAMTRCEEALEHLYAVIVEEPAESAIAALKAAAIYQHDPLWSSRIKQAVDLREDPAVSRVHEEVKSAGTGRAV